MAMKMHLRFEYTKHVFCGRRIDAVNCSTPDQDEFIEHPLACLKCVRALERYDCPPKENIKTENTT